MVLASFELMPQLAVKKASTPRPPLTHLCANTGKENREKTQIASIRNKTGKSLLTLQTSRK